MNWPSSALIPRVTVKDELVSAMQNDSDANPIDAAQRCSSCALRNICLPEGLESRDYALLESVICTSKRVQRGEALYKSGDAFSNIYVVRVGSFKTVVNHPDGREQVTRFDITGESLGLDGVFANQHSCDAIALEDSTVCIISFERLEELCSQIKLMQRHVHKLMSGEIVRTAGQMMLLGNMRADERVAAFLLNISERMKSRGYSATEFNLRMSRAELASYLGMKLETVSRMFSRFQRDKLINTQGRAVRILDMDGLSGV